MDCPHKWSLGGLIRAFVDLCTVYLFLCASAVAYIAYKFLGLFGLCLPCPCGGLFVAEPNQKFCFKNLFIDYPVDKISCVQFCVRTKFPFNDSSVCGKKENKYNLNLRLIGETERDVVQLEGEASCCSLSDARNSSNVLTIEGELNKANDEIGKEFSFSNLGRFDMKGKEIMYQKPRIGVLHHRRKWDSNTGKQQSPMASYDSRFGEIQCDQEEESSHSVNKEENELADDDYPRFLDDEIYSHLDHDERRTSPRLGERFSTGIGLKENCDEDEDNLESRGDGEAGQIDDEKITIKYLLEALKEERDASTSLYLELDKERSAAASAADEAMAMIQRLQKEKASIEMEARQYQRIIEDKSAYDAEETNILKEIIIRREWEKHFLEKEVEAYRQMIGNEQQTVNTRDVLDSQILNSLLDTNEDPGPLLQQLSASIDEKKGSVRALTESSIEALVRPSGELPQLSGVKDDEQQEIEDKMAPTGDDSSTLAENPASLEKLTRLSKINSSLEMSPEENMSLVEGAKLQVNKQEVPSENIETESPCNSSEKATLVHDVHVVVSQSNPCNQINRSKEELFPQSSTIGSTKMHVTQDSSSEASVFERDRFVSDALNSSSLDSEVPIKRSSSDTACRLPPLPRKSKLQLSDLRKNTMFAVDYERLKIESEIGLLRDRLRAVQEGRGKLNLSLDHREREKNEFDLLDDIASQLQEIRQLTGAGKSARESSLPLLSSKAGANRRRFRSASVEPLSSAGIS